MSFASDTGYIPSTIEDLMDIVMAGVNTQFGTSYTTETFLGTNMYKYFYALIQRLQEAEVKTSEIVLKLQTYFIQTNEKITRPNTTYPGILDYFKARGYQASCKPMIDADAGKISVCVNVDDSLPNYPDVKLAINTIIKDCVVAGVVSQGTEVSTITLSNLQSFDFKFYLPDLVPVKLRLTLTISTNNQYTIPSDEVIKQRLADNIAGRYTLGLAFEPQRYFTVSDAEFASVVLLEYSLDGGTSWSAAVYDSDFDELLTYELTDISVVLV